MKPIRAQEHAVGQLCPSCGLCCNGVLFGDVELQEEDDAQRLAELGLAVKRKRKVFGFVQPCSCFDGKLCRIYADRPARCRSFDCGLLKDVQNGKQTTAEALKVIERTRRQVKRVRDLLESLGQTDDALPLSRRCAKVISEPIDLAASEEKIELRAELMLAIHKLTDELQRNFLT